MGRLPKPALNKKKIMMKKKKKKKQNKKKRQKKKKTTTYSDVFLQQVYTDRNHLWFNSVLPYVPIPLERIRQYWRLKDYKENRIKNVYTLGVLESVNGIWAKLHSTIKTKDATISLDISQIPETLSTIWVHSRMLSLGEPARIFGRLEIREKEMIIVVQKMLSVTDVNSCARSLKLAAKVAEQRVSRYRYDRETSDEKMLIEIQGREMYRKCLEKQMAEIEKEEEKRRKAKEEKEDDKLEEELWRSVCGFEMETEDCIPIREEKEAQEAEKDEEKESDEREEARWKMEKEDLQKTIEDEQIWKATTGVEMCRRMMEACASRRKAEEDLWADVLFTASDASA